MISKMLKVAIIIKYIPLQQGLRLRDVDYNTICIINY